MIGSFTGQTGKSLNKLDSAELGSPDKSGSVVVVAVPPSNTNGGGGTTK